MVSLEQGLSGIDQRDGLLELRLAPFVRRFLPGLFFLKERDELGISFLHHFHTTGQHVAEEVFRSSQQPFNLARRFLSLPLPGNKSLRPLPAGFKPRPDDRG